MNETEMRFWEKVKKTRGCWYWTAGCDGSGNPAFKADGKQVSARRYAFALVNGEVLPRAVHLEPSCKNVLCIRPDHMLRVKAGAARHHHAAAEFWSRVDRSGGPNACWTWQGARLSGGRRLSYGKFTYVKDGVSRTVGAHIFAWEEKNGPVPEGEVLRHIICRNPPCVNPRHMTTGSCQDNSNDMVRDGTSLIGARNPKAKLTPAKIEYARRARADGRMLKDVAAELGVHREVLSRALRGETWRAALEQHGARSAS